jgi:hypothetical protein
MKPYLRSLMAQLAAAAFLAVSLLQPAQAAMISTDALIQESQAEAPRAAVQRALQVTEVRTQLAAWGVTVDAVESRLAHLSDAELQQLAADLEAAPAGGLAGALGILFVVLLVLELVGVINIFNAF